MIAACGPEVAPEEQARRLREATIFLTNGFVRINRTLTLIEGAPSQVTLRSALRYVAARNGLSRAATRAVIEDYLSVVSAGVLLGERVPLGRLGRLHLSRRAPQKARVGRNPATGEQILIPAKPATMVPRFSASAELKERAGLLPVEGE